MKNRSRIIEAVVIGASAGGVQAMMRLLEGLPPRFSLPMVAVLHIPKSQESHLAEVFQPYLALPVCQVLDKQPIEPGRLYFAPPDYHLSVERDRSFSLSCEDPVHFSRPAIDVLMSSAADVYGPALAGILLTGASHDGAAGLARIKAAGGMTLVQDPTEAEASTMPQAAINLFQPDAILNIKGLHAALLAMENP